MTTISIRVGGRWQHKRDGRIRKVDELDLRGQVVDLVDASKTERVHLTWHELSKDWKPTKAACGDVTKPGSDPVKS